MMIFSVFICSNSFSQKTENVFEFNNSTDQIIYRNNNKTISGFKILIGKELIFFSASPYLNKNKLNINIDRITLEKLVSNDNMNKENGYVIYLKSINKYFIIDHLVRKIHCN